MVNSIMSYFGDSYDEMNNLLSEIEEFLENHNISDLMKVVQAALERKGW